MYFDRKKIVYLFVLFILPVSGQETGYLQRIAHWEAQAESVQKHLKLAEIYSETGNLKQAVYHFEKAVEKEPALSSLKRLATAYEKYGRPDKAIAVREKIDTADSLLLENRYKLALLYTQNNQKKKAIALLNLLEKADSLNPAYPYKTGIYEQNFDRKLNAFLRAYRKDTAYIKTIYMLVKYYKKIQFSDSVAYYVNKGLKLRPGDTKLLRQKVINEYAQKDYKAMLRTLNILDSLHYDRLFVYKNTGLAYLMLDKNELAKPYLDKAFNKDVRDVAVNHYLGLWYMRNKMYPEARGKFNYVIHLKTPDWDKEFFQLGLIEKTLKHYKEAITYFRKAWESNRKNKDALWQLALLSEVYYKDLNIAIGYYQTYLERFSGSSSPELTRFIKDKISRLKKQVFLSQ